MACALNTTTFSNFEVNLGWCVHSGQDSTRGYKSYELLSLFKVMLMTCNFKVAKCGYIKYTPKKTESMIHKLKLQEMLKRVQRFWNISAENSVSGQHYRTAKGYIRCGSHSYHH